MVPDDPIVICGAARTPIGGFQGDFKDLTAPQLGAIAIRAAVERAGLASDERHGSGLAEQALRKQNAQRDHQERQAQ